jgi:hypothetical protein
MLAFNVVPINDIHQSALILGQKKWGIEPTQGPKMNYFNIWDAKTT